MSNFTDQYTLTARDNTKAAFRSFSGNVDGAGRSVRRLMGFAAGLAGAYGFGALIRSSFQTGDQLGKTADRLDITTESLGGFRHAVSQTTELSGGAFDNALERMTRRLSEVATTGSGPAANALRDLRLNAEELDGLTTDEKMFQIADAMQGLESNSDRVRVAYRLFGNEGVSLVNTLSEGREGLEAFQADAERLGGTLTRIDVARLEAANDSLDRVGMRIRGIANDTAVAAAPAIEAMANLFIDSSDAAGGFSEVATSGMDHVVKGIGVMADGMRGFQALWPGLKLVANQAIASLLAGMGAVEDGFRRMADFIPGITVEAHSWFTHVAKDFQRVADEAQEELHDLLMRPLPSQQIEAYYQTAKAEAASAAEAINKAQGSVGGFDFVDEEGGSSPFDFSDLHKLEESLQSEREKIRAHHAKRMDIVWNAYQAEDGISAEHRDSLLMQLQGKHEAELSEIQRKEEEKREAEEAARQESIDRISTFLMSEEDRIRAAYEERLKIVEENVRDEDKAEEMRNQLRARREEEITALSRQGAQDRVRWAEWEAQQKITWAIDSGTEILGALDNYVNSANAVTESEFERQKQFSKSVAIISGLAAGIKAFVEMPWWQAAAASTAIALNTAATVRRIDQQQWNGGDSSPVGSPGPASSVGSGSGPVSDGLRDRNENLRPEVHIMFQGDMAAFAKSMRQYTKDTGDNVIDPDSDNARRINKGQAA